MSIVYTKKCLAKESNRFNVSLVILDFTMLANFHGNFQQVSLIVNYFDVYFII